MTEKILLLTGKLAEGSLRKVLLEMQPQFDYEIRQMGVSVAALMTADMIRKRLESTDGADRILLPGRCRGDIEALSQHFGITVERGPKELKDLPAYFGAGPSAVQLDRHEVTIFAELVDAPLMTVEQILAQAAAQRADGADVVDLGCLPDTPFAHLEAAVTALKQAGFTVSVDSLQPDELERGARAGADYLLSLTEHTLETARDTAARPVLIPAEAGDLASLCRAIERLRTEGRTFIADPILDPIHFGFTDAIARYRELRQRYPEVEIMMGTGNLTELTDADTTGIAGVMMGIVSELHIGHVLTTQVSKHCRSVIRETDRARRMMYATREMHNVPQGVDDGLLALHDKKPFPYSSAEISEAARAVRDPSFRIQVGEQGIHIYNRDCFHTARDPFDLYPQLGVEGDGGHAFYLGVELARAQIAWQLGKRYVQDEELHWGAVVAAPEEDLSEYRPAGSTLAGKRGGGAGE